MTALGLAALLLRTVPPKDPAPSAPTPSSPATAPSVPGPAATDTALPLGDLLLAGLVGLLVGVLVTALVLLLLRRRPPTAPPAPRPASTPLAAEARPGPVADPAQDPGGERRLLVDGLADLARRLPPPLDGEADRLLARAGVVRRTADGLRFDPTWQTAVGSLPAVTAGQVGSVARTERDFYDDRGRPASAPLVVVHVAPHDDSSPSTSGPPR